MNYRISHWPVVGSGVVLAGVMALVACASGPPALRVGELRTSVLARPTADKALAARKINELFLHENRLYIGHGDYGVNTGPTDVLYYDLATGKVVKEFTVDDEAIVRYRVLDGQLVIPGPDATEDWKFGNIYVRNGAWVKRRTLPNAVHVLDVAALGNTWYAATGMVVPIPDEEHGFACGAVVASVDQGRSWDVQFTTAANSTAVSRIGSLAVYRGQLFVFPYAYTEVAAEQVPADILPLLTDPIVEKDHPQYLQVLPEATGPMDAAVFDGKAWRNLDLIPARDLCSVRTAVFQDRLVLVAVCGEFVPSASHYSVAAHGKLRTMSTSVWTCDGRSSQPAGVEMDVVTDVLVKAEGLYLLGLKDGRWCIAATSDLARWSVLNLPAPGAEPLSLEQNEGVFYIGLADGTILQARSEESSR